MAIDTDALLDRMKLKRQLKRWRSLVIIMATLLLFFLALSAVPGLATTHGFGQNYIALIDIKGLITADRDVRDSLTDIAENDRVKAVLVNIESPGGTAVGGEIIYEKLKEIQQHKPVVALMHNMATSAAYLIALPADRIYARKATITGSIGVILQSPNIEGLAQKIGVDMDVVKTGKLKGMPNPFKPLDEEARTVMQSMVDDFYQVFIDAIVVHRDLPKLKVMKLADGRVYTGRQALDNQLIDAIGGQEEAIAWLQDAKQLNPKLKVKNVQLKKKKSPLQELLGTVGGKFFPLSEQFSLHGLLSIWQNTIIH